VVSLIAKLRRTKQLKMVGEMPPMSLEQIRQWRLSGETHSEELR